MSYLTADELDAVCASGLDPFTPYVIENASMVQQADKVELFGGYLYLGRLYRYLRSTDELIRSDVVDWVMARRKEAQRARREADEAQQMEML